MNRALTLKWFAVLGLASLFYLLAPRDVSPQMPLYLGMTSAGSSSGPSISCPPWLSPPR